MKRPNIIVFFSDQQRWDTCNCYGQPLEGVTPNLDRMAAEGVRFENAFTCQPVCGPARAALQTGQYPEFLGCFRNGRQLPLDAPTIAKRLNAAGYETGYIGKWHLAAHQVEGERVDFHDAPIPPERRGGYEDYWLAADLLEATSHSYDGHMYDADMKRVDFPEGRYRADAMTDYVLDFLKSRDGEKPFFLFVSYIEPHHQNDHKHYEGPKGSKERFKNFVAPGDLIDAEGDWRDEYPDYLGCVHNLDENLGRIRDALDELNMSDDTVLFYTSDHGSHFRTRNSEYKRACHDGCIRIPMIAAGPGFEKGKVVEELVSLINLPPTIADLAGSPPTAGEMREDSLMPLVRGEARDWQEEVFLQISESQVGRAIRTNRWKYSVTAPEADARFGSRSDVYVEDFLYDLDDDPHERNNLVRDPAYAAVRADMAERLIKRMEKAGESAPEIKPAIH